MLQEHTNRSRPRSRHSGALVGLALCALAVTGCTPTDPDAGSVRGRGLRVVHLPAATEASIYGAAVRAAFDVQPGLVLLAHARRLPRTSGTAGGDTLPPALIAALEDRNVVTGRCEPKRESAKDTPRCAVESSGYIIRATPVMRVAGDTVQIYFSAETYAPASGRKPSALRFEKVYQLVGKGTNWRVVREARSPEDGR